jgi:hypothetical protein
MESKPPPKPRARSAGSVQITERDRLILCYAAEHRFVVAAQLAVVLETTEPAADARLRALGAGGLLRRERKLHRQPPCDQVTREGLRAIAGDLPVPRKLDLATYRHDLALGWLTLAAQRGRFGAAREVVSERRMRSEDGRTGGGRAGYGRATGLPARHGVRLGGVGPNGQERLHYPDMVLVTETGHRIAFELELTSKSPARRERILAGYAADRSIDAVVYLVDHAPAGRAIERSAARVGIPNIVHVQTAELEASRPSADGGRAAQRGHRRRPAQSAQDIQAAR